MEGKKTTDELRRELEQMIARRKESEAQYKKTATAQVQRVLKMKQEIDALKIASIEKKRSSKKIELLKQALSDVEAETRRIDRKLAKQDKRRYP